MPSIVVLEHQEEVRLFLQNTLKVGCGGEIRSASALPEALAPEAGGADVFVVGHHPPEMDGVEAILKLRADARFAEVPMVLVTASDDPHVLELSFAAGAMDFIRTPFDRKEFLMRIRSALRHKAEGDARKVRERELHETNLLLQQMSFVDALSVVPSRHFFDVMFEREWRRATRDDEEISALLVDVDHFRAFNDAYGLKEGDDCLRRVASTLTSGPGRPGDVVARHGKDEFIVLLPRTGLAGAVHVADKIRVGVETLQIPHASPAGEGRVTVSIGAASIIPRTDLAPASLVDASEKALQLAKREGGNRVRFRTMASLRPSPARQEKGEEDRRVRSGSRD